MRSLLSPASAGHAPDGRVPDMSPHATGVRSWVHLLSRLTMGQTPASIVALCSLVGCLSWVSAASAAPAAPTIDAESASVVTSSSATLDATIDANGTPTTYYFQYGPTDAYGTDVPAAPGASLGSAEVELPVSIHQQGLAPHTLYHYRVVAVGQLNGETVTTEGPDSTFTTQGAGSQFTQPDGREWEQVTPLDKYGAGIIALGNEGGEDIQAAENGDGIVFSVTSPFTPHAEGSYSPEVTEVKSSRQAPGVWQSQDLSTPHEGPPMVFLAGRSEEYKLFSNDLSLGMVEPNGETPLPPLPPNSEKTIYLRTANGAYEALVTAANVPPGTEFGGAFSRGRAARVGFVAASPDFSHIVLGSEVALSPPLVKEAPEGTYLYMWDAGHIQLASILPNHEPVQAALGRNGEAQSRPSFGNVRHAVSNDGSRIVFESREAESGLYLRDLDKDETVQVDSPAQGAVVEPGSAHSLYTTASSDDSRVFFTSRARLTADSTASVEGQAEDLYEYEVTSGPAEPLAGKLTDLTVDANADESAAVQGVIGASEDGTYVYFVANGLLGDALESGATPGRNLYVEHFNSSTGAWERPRFIAQLSVEDEPSWGGRNRGGEDLQYLTARVSPNGNYLAFMSDRSLTGYENRDANSGVADEEVFLYDAGRARLACASCNPTGARPVGLYMADGYDERLVEYGENWNRRWLAGNIPGWTKVNLGDALYQSRYLSNSGRLFFNSSDALVPADVNGKADVYEYEPVGVGSCQPPTYGESASDVFVEAVDGCVALISAGTSSEESAFMDASETGGDVMFLTLSRLAPSDYDTSLDLYDAHECSESAPCAPPAALTSPPCTTGDACKSAPTPQPTIFGSPSSETFSGAGNITQAAVAPIVKSRSSTRAQKLLKALRACKGKPKRKRASCESRARKKYGAKGSRERKSLSVRAGR